MATDRPPSFQWFPRDFASKMHQLRVDDLTELAYRRALDASWDSGSYGVGTLDEWIRWGLGSDPQATLKASLATLVKCETQAQPDGTLVQMRMVLERNAQVTRRKQAAEHGSIGGRKSKGGKRRKQRSSDPQATLDQPSSGINPLPLPLQSASAVEEKKNTPRAQRAEREPEGFARFYETAYPRRDGRRAAAKAFASALKRNPTYTPENLSEGAMEFRKRVAAEGTEPRFIPMPATWLNQDRFREFFDESEDGHAANP